MKLKYFLQKFNWMKVYFSPFKPPMLKLYIGKVAIGTPYFYPRVWVKGNHKLIHEGVLRRMDETKSFNQRNQEYKRKEKSYDELYEEMKTYSFAVPKKIGFDFVDLGWKTKWEPTDYRFEWSPVWSFVFFKWQIAITFVPIEPHHYWECWLYYSRETKHIAKTTEGRLAIARKKFPCVWSSTRDGVKTTTCYWDVILKKKYL
jgi:hypothetical protein